MSPIAGFHHHFYQPPREDPWLGDALNEWGAWPYHDWNERITAECYRALTAVALPGEDGTIELVEPLTRCSFDIGPTLYHWIERYAPDVDRSLAYQVRHAPGGPGVVVAAPLVHAILPLASAVDRQRLVAWGIADYVARFGEAPRGLWLPETAVDLATLEVLVDQHVRYTILMPGQAVRVRSPGGHWAPVDADSLDTSRPYLVRLPSGRTITVVFGHSSLSQHVAFSDLIDDGTKLADTMFQALNGGDGLVLVVADGETYGHHHRFGDMGLAWAQRRLANDYGVNTSLDEWLKDQEPTHEVELAAQSAWSCAHGVERWRSDCGCVTGQQPGWNQEWRVPLRGALDWLRETLGSVVDERLAELVDSVDATLLDYGTVLAGATTRDEFVRRHSNQALDDDETSTVLELCEVHRNLQYSFTSCAWFFADPAEIETSTVLRYAAVAIEIASQVLGVDLEADFVARLDEVHSNRPGIAGGELWRRACDPYRADEALVAAGFAAERFACAHGARHDRGFWHAEFETLDESSGALNIKLSNTLTLRRSVFHSRVQRTHALGIRVYVGDGNKSKAYDLGDLGDDVVARIAASWLVAPESLDFEGALNALTVELLERPAGHEELKALVALAGASRYVSPIGEASIRRALVAAVGRGNQGVDLDLVAPLARAVGLGDMVERT